MDTFIRTLTIGETDNVNYAYSEKIGRGMSDREWATYARARSIWLTAGALSRSEAWIVRTFGANVLYARAFTGWFS